MVGCQIFAHSCMGHRQGGQKSLGDGTQCIHSAYVSKFSQCSIQLHVLRMFGLLCSQVPINHVFGGCVILHVFALSPSSTLRHFASPCFILLHLCSPFSIGCAFLSFFHPFTFSHVGSTFRFPHWLILCTWYCKCFHLLVHVFLRGVAYVDL